jgi:SAM-dependent methyltransferase
MEKEVDLGEHRLLGRFDNGNQSRTRQIEERIEILSVSLLDQHRPVVEELKQLARSLGIGIGWHYLLDWIWILSILSQVRGTNVLDAGAGEGLLQWFLAGKGYEVLSVDRASRAELSLRYRARYRVQGLRPADLNPGFRVWLKNIRMASRGSEKLASTIRGLGGLAQIALPFLKAPGNVWIFNQGLADMATISDRSQDAIVAVSSLEHNSPQGLEKVVNELIRVLKPGGILLATLGAAQDQDWFHGPSQGWCYTEPSLRRIFNLSPGVPSNYDHYDDLMESLRGCSELREDLAGFYFRSGDNGMPWGKWDPQYQPVGICKVKNLVGNGN